MSIPIKINPLGINSSIYISSPLIGKGTQSDPISLSFNPVYFRVDNDTNQFNINTTNIALKQDLNNYLPLSGGIITGPTVFNTREEIKIGIDSANNEYEGGQLHLLGNNKSDGWIIDQYPGVNKYGSLRFYSDQVFSNEGLPTISFTYNNPNQPVLHIGNSEQIDSRIYVRGIEGTYFNNEKNPILQLNWNTRAETISNGLFTIRIPSFEKENQIFKIQSDAAPASGMLILQNFANNDSAVVEGFSLIHVNNSSNTQTIDLVFDKANQPNFWVNSNVHFTKTCNLSENIYVTSSLVNITSNVKSNGVIYTNSFFNSSLTTFDINDNSSLKGARIWSSKDKNEKDLFYAETWLGTGSNLYGQLVIPDKTYSQFRTLSIGYDENNVPFLGLCLGMQCAVIEYARNVVGIKDANSKEFDENAQHPVIDLMLEQKNVHGYGGTMRLGAYDCVLKKGSKAHKAYGKDKISERHRHRYEVNNEYLKQIEDAGLVFSGMSPDGMLAEIVELPKLDWFVASQFHPEFKSRPERPHPLFKGLIDAAVKKR